MSEVKKLPENADLVDIIAEAIEKVVDRRFQSLESLLNQVNEKFISKKEKESSLTDIDSSKNMIEETTEKKRNKETKEEIVEDVTEKKKSKMEIPDTSEKKRNKESKDEKKSKDKKDDKPAKVVKIAYKINCISDINSVSCTFEISMKIFYIWEDKKLIGRKKGSSVEYEEDDGLFNPEIGITNDHNLEEISKVTKITDSDKGEIKQTITYKGTVFLLNLNLRSFPYDCQNLQICFKPYKMDCKKVLLEAKAPDECAMDVPIMHEWKILGHCIKTFFTDPLTSSTNKSYSTLFVVINVKRESSWFTLNLFLPTAALLMICWLTFFYGDDEMSERNSVTMNTLLASIANKYVTEGQIPKVSYRTMADRYVDICFLLQILTIFSNFIVAKFHTLPMIGSSLNTLCFLVQVIIAGLFHEWMFTYLNNLQQEVEEWLQETNKQNELNTKLNTVIAEDILPELSKEPVAGNENRLKLLRRASFMSSILSKFDVNINEDFNDGSSSSLSGEMRSMGVPAITDFILHTSKKTSQKEVLKNKILEEQVLLKKEEKGQSIVGVLNIFKSRSQSMCLTDLEKETKAATMVQRLWRRKMIVANIRRLQKEHDMIVRCAAAVRIQRLYRLRRSAGLRSKEASEFH